jgi:pyruvate formate lyase activating enzyme
MKKARLYQKLPKKMVRCQACSWHCQLAPGKTGICGVRQNLNGDLYLLVYGQALGMQADPMEKKPLFHFLPGQSVLSFGTFGCDFDCQFCQNWEQSQSTKKIPPQDQVQFINQYSQEFSPQEIVNLAQKQHLPAIAYTYNEPAVFFEYALDTMKLAKKAGLKNVFVSNGFESEQTFKQLKGYLDAINIDLKSFQPEFYQRICKAKLEPVLANIKKFFHAGIWVEITTLIIDGHNDSSQELNKIARFIRSVSPNIPWHVTACHPDYQMLDIKPTPARTLFKAYDIGKKCGLNFVYVGNILDTKHSATYCPYCQAELVSRSWHQTKIIKLDLKTGKCKSCHKKIPGVWH